MECLAPNGPNANTANTINSLMVLAGNFGGFVPAKAEESDVCIESLPSHPLVVVLLETHCLLASTVLSRYVVPAAA